MFLFFPRNIAEKHYTWWPVWSPRKVSHQNQIYEFNLPIFKNTKDLFILVKIRIVFILPYKSSRTEHNLANKINPLYFLEKWDRENICDTAYKRVSNYRGLWDQRTRLTSCHKDSAILFMWKYTLEMSITFDSTILKVIICY